MLLAGIWVKVLLYYGRFKTKYFRGRIFISSLSTVLGALKCLNKEEGFNNNYDLIYKMGMVE